jgi:hypothetical protein
MIFIVSVNLDNTDNKMSVFVNPKGRICIPNAYSGLIAIVRSSEYAELCQPI